MAVTVLTIELTGVSASGRAASSSVQGPASLEGRERWDEQNQRALTARLSRERSPTRRPATSRV